MAQCVFLSITLFRSKLEIRNLDHLISYFQSNIFFFQNSIIVSILYYIVDCNVTLVFTNAKTLKFQLFKAYNSQKVILRVFLVTEMHFGDLHYVGHFKVP